jgi:predicted transcriptional regulator/transcriptional regulator with XRE-family HTH domain
VDGYDLPMGQRLRELRLERGLQQGEVARRLSVSPAYLSLIEKGKRAVQLPLLFRALELYGVSMEQFMASLGERHVDDGLAKLLDEPLLRSLNLTEEDLASLSAEPKVVTTITALFNLYKNTRSQLDNLLLSLSRRAGGRGGVAAGAPAAVEGGSPGAGAPDGDDGGGRDSPLRFDYSPFDEVIDFLERHGNWFRALEERADALRAEAGLGARVGSNELMRVMRERLGIDVRVVPPSEASSVVRRWDPASGVMTVSSAMPEQRLKFQLAATIGLRLLDEERHDEAILAAAAEPRRHVETRKLLKIHLANYVAGALLLPYDEFFREVQRTRYDVELLASLFESSYETVAHRVCNLSDPRKRGVPFHFSRVDVAGNISKRYSQTGIRFPVGTGSCPKWATNMAFLTPSVLTRQYSVFPDGATYFCFAKVIANPEQGSLARGTLYSIGLGTYADNARHLCYADDMPFADPAKMAVPVGTTCRFCERTDCNQRAAPSYKFAFRVDEYTKKDNFFSPLVSADEADEGRVVTLGRKRGA